jgi:uncharacterized protein (TIGR02421 family)
MSAGLSLIGKAPPFDAAFGPTGALRQDFGAHGRVHIDRALPFIVLHRDDPERGESVARRVALTSPAYAVWQGPADDAAALTALETVVAEQRRRFGAFLAIMVDDLPRPAAVPDDAPELPAFRAEIGAPATELAQSAARALGAAMATIEIDLRLCEVAIGAGADAPAGIAALFARHRDCALVSIGLPRIHDAPGGKGIYPQLIHDLAVATFDALLKAACAFMTDAGLGPPRHYRALGRSAFIEAAKSVDAKLDRICRSFDFLLSVSPINTTQAFAQFRADKWVKAPDFRYRPLTVDPSEAKRTLYRIDLRAVEDPVLETLFSEKRQEVDHQLTMLEARNTPRFPFASLMLYEPVDSSLRETAAQILAADPACPPAPGGTADCHAVADAAQTMVERYAVRDPAFDVNIELRDDIAAGMMVSGRNLYVSTSTAMPAHRVVPLLHHEVGVHLLTYVNGSKQGLGIFKRGLAGYEGVQEGLGVFAEWVVGGLTRARLRLLAARVVAVDAMIDGGGFIDVFRLLRREHGFSDHTAFLITARVFRGGGFAKDAIYLRGFKAVLDMLAAGQSLDPFWYGKIDTRHLGVVEELAERGILHKPALAPEFLANPEVTARIASFRQHPSYSSLL